MHYSVHSPPEKPTSLFLCLSARARVCVRARKREDFVVVVVVVVCVCVGVSGWVGACMRGCVGVSEFV